MSITTLLWALQQREAIAMSDRSTGGIDRMLSHPHVGRPIARVGDVVISSTSMLGLQDRVQLRVEADYGTAGLRPQECRELARELHRLADIAATVPSLEERTERIDQIHDALAGDGRRTAP